MTRPSADHSPPVVDLAAPGTSATGSPLVPRRFPFKRGVQGGLLFVAIVFGLLVLSLPLSVFLLFRRKSGGVTFDAENIRIRGLGLPLQLAYRDIARIGTLSIQVNGAGPLASALNGSNPGLTLAIKTRAGKTHSVMLSRFEETEEILASLQRNARTELESLSMGTFGVKWPETL